MDIAWSLKLQEFSRNRFKYRKIPRPQTLIFTGSCVAHKMRLIAVSIGDAVCYVTGANRCTVQECRLSIGEGCTSTLHCRGNLFVSKPVAQGILKFVMVFLVFSKYHSDLKRSNASVFHPEGISFASRQAVLTWFSQVLPFKFLNTTFSYQIPPCSLLFILPSHLTLRSFSNLYSANHQ
jgi:hypothetical protein